MSYQSLLITLLDAPLGISGTTTTVTNDLVFSESITIDDADAVITNRKRTLFEMVKVNIVAGAVTFTKRGLTKAGTYVEDVALKRSWKKGDYLYITQLAPSIVDKGDDNIFPGNQTFLNILFNGTLSGTGVVSKVDFSALKLGFRFPNVTTAERLAIPLVNGLYVHDTTIGEDYHTLGGAWYPLASGSTQPNGTTIVAGKYQTPSNAQILANTVTGSTGAELAITVANTKSTSSGVSDAGKIPVMNSSGKLDSSIVSNPNLISATLGETITSADPVFLINNSGAKIYKYIGYLGSRTNVTGWVSSSSINTIDANSKVQYISTDKFVMLYTSWNGSVDQVTAVIGTISSLGIVFGTPTTITGSSNTLQSISICEIGIDKFVVARKNSNSTTIDTLICTVSGTTITVGSVQTAITTSGTFTTMDICKVATDKFAVCASATANHIVCATVLGTTATFGSNITPSISIGSLVQVANDKIVGTDGTNIRIYTTSGTTITEQANFAIGITYSNPTLVNYSTTSSYVVFSGTTGGNAQAFIVDASGTTASKGTTVTVATSTTNTACSLSMVNDVLVVTGGNRFNYLTVSGTTLLSKNNYTTIDSIQGYKSISYGSLKQTIACLGNKATNPGAWVFNNNRKSVLGIAQESGVITDTKTVAVIGSPSLVHTGLTPGDAQYISDTTGSITTNSSNSVFIGRAVSTTSIINELIRSSL